MHDLYDQLLAGGEGAIAQLVSERRQENVSLEFKTKANPANGEPTKEDRQNLARALSAFSNSMGGVIVWGITANKDEDGVDCATECQPIASIERFKADVTRLISQALIPRHEGILVELIPARRPRGAGYLAIYVERSERRPHRAELGVGRYFKRIGDSSVAMEHYDIEDSFKRLVVPWLEVKWLTRPGGALVRPGGGNSRWIAIDVLVCNPSPVTARFPYLTLSNIRGAIARRRSLGDDYQPGLRHIAEPTEDRFSGGADDVIHPGITLAVAQLRTPEIYMEPTEGGHWRIARGSLQPVTVAYQCGCYNSRPTNGKFTVSDDELVDRGIEGGFIY